MNELKYFELEMQPYLKSKVIYKEQAQTIFRYRTRMVDVKNNFKNGNLTTSCLLCLKQNNIEEDTQQHLLKCPTVHKEDPKLISNTVNYNDIFSRNIFNIKKTVEALTKALNIRNSKLENMQ